jgi:hypothetical protein
MAIRIIDIDERIVSTYETRRFGATEPVAALERYRAPGHRVREDDPRVIGWHRRLSLVTYSPRRRSWSGKAMVQGIASVGGVGAGIGQKPVSV